MTAAEVAAALYAFSNLIDDVPEANSRVVRDELSFVVAKYGMAAIECAANSLETKEGEHVGEFLRAFSRQLERAPAYDRLDWCEKRAALAFGATSA